MKIPTFSILSILVIVVSAAPLNPKFTATGKQTSTSESALSVAPNQQIDPKKAKTGFLGLTPSQRVKAVEIGTAALIVGVAYAPVAKGAIRAWKKKPAAIVSRQPYGLENEVPEPDEAADSTSNVDNLSEIPVRGRRALAGEGEDSSTEADAAPKLPESSKEQVDKLPDLENLIEDVKELIKLQKKLFNRKDLGHDVRPSEEEKAREKRLEDYDNIKDLHSKSKDSIELQRLRLELHQWKKSNSKRAQPASVILTPQSEPPNELRQLRTAFKKWKETNTRMGYILDGTDPTQDEIVRSEKDKKINSEALIADLKQAVEQQRQICRRSGNVEANWATDQQRLEAQLRQYDEEQMPQGPGAGGSDRSDEPKVSRTHAENGEASNNMSDTVRLRRADETPAEELSIFRSKGPEPYGAAGDDGHVEEVTSQQEDHDSIAQGRNEEDQLRGQNEEDQTQEQNETDQAQTAKVPSVFKYDEINRPMDCAVQ